MIEPDGLAQTGLMQTVVAPDVTLDGATGLSVGVRFTAAPAQFTP